MVMLEITDVQRAPLIPGNCFHHGINENGHYCVTVIAFNWSSPQPHLPLSLFSAPPWRPRAAFHQQEERMYDPRRPHPAPKTSSPKILLPGLEMASGSQGSHPVGS